MSLKAKLEAVIYAAEEPVTLAQLATLFAAEALEWKAAQLAAAAEQAAEVAGQPPSAGDTLPLLAEDGGALDAAGDETGNGPADDAAESLRAFECSYPITGISAAEGEPEPAAESFAEPIAEVGGAVGAEPLDPESEARRAARQREREVRSVLKQLLDELVAAYAGDASGLEIREIAGGYRMATKPEYHDAVRVFVRSLKPPLKLSLPALETLAVVAYKQPVTAPEVSEIRGVESGGVLGSLLSRKLIATAGRKQVIGRPILYKTTKEFLVRFGLKDVAELPSMEEFEKMAAAEIEEEMEPEAVAADAAEDAAEAEAGKAGLEENEPSGVELADEAAAAGGDGNPEAESPAARMEQSPAGTDEEPAESSKGPEGREDRPEENRVVEDSAGEAAEKS